MKKLTATVLTLLMCVGLLTGCGITVVQYTPGGSTPDAEPTPETSPSGELEVPEGELAMGFYMTTSYDTSYSGSHAASADGNGLAQANIDIYAVTINSEGVIVDCKIDAIQAKTEFDASGALVTEVGADNPSKMELGDDYAMRAASGIGAEWDEQVIALQNYCIGKTPAEIQGIALDDAGKATDADLIAGITMPLGDFIAGVVAACNNARVNGAKEGDTLYLHSDSYLSDSSAAASAEADGLAQNDTTAGAYTLAADGTITDIDLDCVQTKINFNASGELTTEEGTTWTTKTDLDDGYNMRPASPIGAEWDEQVIALQNYCIGKTPAEIQGIALDDAGKATDADLIAGITMPLGDFIAGVVAACNNARVNGAKEGDTLYLHSDSYLSDSSAAASAEADGLAQNDTTAGAYTLAADGTITDIDLDCVQTKINFNVSGELTTEEGTTWTTKTDLDDDYNMRPASPIGAEWDEQTAYFEEYCIGKTVAQVAGISIDAETNHPTEADLITGCTMNVNSFIAVLEKSAA